MRAWRGVPLIAMVLAACAKQGTESTVLQADDLVAPDAMSFNPDEIVDLPSFTDSFGIVRDQLQTFLERTPYNRESFLATYTSNGVRAVDAVTRAAETYRLNPLVFVVRAEMEQGLVGQEFYPSSPARVEYVFGCGCASGQTSCDPALAGFDLQVDCLGRALRTSLDAIAESGVTAGGWAPGQARKTLDGVSVTPADASTAVLYDYTPAVDTGKAGGNWLFWSLWQKYSETLQYAGASGITSTASWIGDACTVDGNCGYTGGVCATNYPGGLCTTPCTDQCPSDPSHVAAYCADFQGQGGYCLPVCNPSAPACRDGYSCQRVAKFGDPTLGEYVCIRP